MYTGKRNQAIQTIKKVLEVLVHGGLNRLREQHISRMFTTIMVTMQDGMPTQIPAKSPVQMEKPFQIPIQRVDLFLHPITE